MHLRIYMGSSTKNIVVLEKYSHPLLIFQFLSVLIVYQLEIRLINHYDLFM